MINITHLVLFLLIGLFAGWLSGKFMKDKGFGTIGNLIVGIIGALIGGHLLGLIGLTTYGLIGSLFMAIVGAVVFLFLASLIKKT
jgi:uncharacterized membrane protein YeaQ/YmgE (transglycosylase-associated protein family)